MATSTQSSPLPTFESFVESKSINESLLDQLGIKNHSDFSTKYKVWLNGIIKENERHQGKYVGYKLGMAGLDVIVVFEKCLLTAKYHDDGTDEPFQLGAGGMLNK